MDAGRLFCFGFAGHEAPDHILFALDRDRVGAVILFERNCRDASQIRALTAQLRDAGGEDLWLLIDQEGGRVRRVHDPDIGPESAEVLGRQSAARTGQSYGDAAKALAGLGIDFNLAPVADVLTNPENEVLRERSFGEDPESVALHVRTAVTAMQLAGLKACAKHFPGLGGVSTDPHHAATGYSGSPEDFRNAHFPPFAAAVSAGVAGVMTTHLLAPALDPQRVATFSPRLVHEFLESELGFRGLVLTDDLEMKGAGASPPDAAWQAFEAGHTLHLICSDSAAQADALRLFKGRISGSSHALGLLRDALDRQASFRKPFRHAAV
jgi:beta-N-acetylhexosaminidase